MQNDNHSAVLLVLVDVLSNKFFIGIVGTVVGKLLLRSQSTLLAVCFDVTVNALAVIFKRCLV